MRKSGNNGRRKIRRGPLSMPNREVETVIGQYVSFRTSVASASTQAMFSLRTDNLDARLGDLSDLYRLYRFVRCELSIVPSTDSENVAAGYFTGVSGGGPTTFAEVTQMDNVVFVPHKQTVPSVLRLGPSDLKGVPVWYVTESVTDPVDDTQGEFFLSAAGDDLTADASVPIPFILRYEVQFKERLPAAVTAMRRKERLERLGLPADETASTNEGFSLVPHCKNQDPRDDRMGNGSPDRGGPAMSVPGGMLRHRRG